MAASATAWRRLEDAEAVRLAVDGVRPRFACAPESYEEAAQTVARAVEEGMSVVPRGSGSGMGLGFPPARADVVLLTRGLNRVVAYEPADLTVTVQAGISIGELQALLRAEGQFLPLDPPGPPEGTLGGIVATNANGPLRFAHGTARDMVIGTRVVGADGQVARAGGRVVKNVAGYDLNKLYIGSLGTLAVLVELSFKLAPLPESFGTVAAVFDDVEHAREAVRLVLRSPLNPQSVNALGTSAAWAVGLDAPDRGIVLLLRAAGFEQAVARQLKDLGAICTDRGGRELPTSSDDVQLWDRVRDLAYAAEGKVLARVSVLLADALPVLAVLEGLARRRDLDALHFGHAGNGTVYARLDVAEEQELEPVCQFLAEARQEATTRGGGLVLEAAPPAVKHRFDVWGEAGPSFGVMKALKQQFDPRGILNPGRFVGRI